MQSKALGENGSLQNAVSEKQKHIASLCPNALGYRTQVMVSIVSADTKFDKEIKSAEYSPEVELCICTYLGCDRGGMNMNV